MTGAGGAEKVPVREEGMGESVQEGGGGDVKVGLIIG